MNTISYISILSFRSIWKIFFEIVWIMNMWMMNHNDYHKLDHSFSCQYEKNIIVLFMINMMNNLNDFWKTTKTMNTTWKQIKKIIVQNVREFFSNVTFKILIFECMIKNETLCFKKKWMSKNKKLCIKLIQTTHDSSFIEHSEKKIFWQYLYGIFFRQI